MNETLKVGGLTFEVRRSSRRKTLGLTVDRHGELLVHAPEGEPTTRIETWVHSKLLWVHQRLAAKERLASALREPEFVLGERFSVLGRQYQLRIDPAQEEPLRFDGRKLCPSTQAIPAAAHQFRM
jgi:predicted metal-dependent hydrolase